MGKSRVDYNMKLFTAIAMVLVVSAHLDGGQTGLAGPYNLFRPYAFHVAAFVFVSGYFYKPASEQAPWRYLVRKAKRLIVPLFLVSAVYGYVWVLARMAVGMPDVSLPTVQNLLIDPLISSHQYRFTAALWFLTPLFCTEVLNVLMRKALARVPWPSKTVREAVLFVAYLLLGTVSILVGGAQGIEPSWLLLVCRTLLFVSFFGMGRFYREVLEPHDTLGSTWYFAIVLFAQLIVAVACHGNYTYTPSWCRYPHGILGTYAVTMLGIAFLLRICKLLGPVVGQSRVVLAIANNSFSVMCHHQCGFFVLNYLFYLLSAATGLPQSFDVGEFVSNSQYMMPLSGAGQFVLVYVVFAIAFSLCVHGVWVRIRGLASRAGAPAHDTSSSVGSARASGQR